MIRLATPDKHNTRLIQRVYEVYPDESPLEFWFDKVREGSAFLYEQAKELPTIDCAGLVEIHEGSLQVRVGGGLDGRLNVPEVFNFLKFMCYVLDKSSLRLYGRRGWWKYLKSLGFEIIEEISSCAPQKKSSYIFEYEIKKREEKEKGEEDTNGR